MQKLILTGTKVINYCMYAGETWIRGYTKGALDRSQGLSYTPTCERWLVTYVCGKPFMQLQSSCGTSVDNIRHLGTFQKPARANILFGTSYLFFVLCNQ